VGTEHLCVLDPQGRVECAPRIAEGPFESDRVVESGDGFACVDSGSFYCSGAWSFYADSAQGVAGERSACWWDADGVHCDRHPDSPQDVSAPPLVGVTQVFGGFEHYCALDASGLPTCWGRDDHGQATPPAVPFVQLALGRHHSCGRQADGSVLCWGAGTPTAANGNGEHFGQASPPMGTFVDLAAGEDFTCARFADGTRDCWGRWTTTDTRAGGVFAMEPPPE
jgi:hypothetical protein